MRPQTCQKCGWKIFWEMINFSKAHPSTEEMSQEVRCECPTCGKEVTIYSYEFHARVVKHQREHPMN